MSCSAAAHCRRSKVITAPVWSQSIQAAAVRAVHRWVAGTVGLGLPDSALTLGVDGALLHEGDHGREDQRGREDKNRNDVASMRTTAAPR